MNNPKYALELFLLVISVSLETMKVVAGLPQLELRYRVENFFCRLKCWACTSTRCDKLASHFLSLIQFASVIDWLRYDR